MVTPPYVARPLRLTPFRGLMLTPRRVGDPASGRLFARPYLSVAGRLLQWQERGQLHHDDEPALYLHEYTAGGLTVRGLVGALELGRRAARPEDRAVLPHEGIRPVQADDLADRMTQLELNPAPILLVHRSHDDARAALAEVARGATDHEFDDRAGQHHRIWAIRDPALLERLEVALAGSRALIADGHHRYAAYLRMQSRAPGGAADRGLAMLVDQGETPLFLGPIHRVLTKVSLEDLATAAAATGGRFAPTDRDAAVAALDAATMAVTDGRAWGTLSLPVGTDRAVVEALHEDLVPALPRGPQAITHFHTVEATLAGLRRGQDVGLLMPAPDVDLVIRIAEDDRLLPEKATSFQPKPSPGVLIRSLRDG